MLLVACSKVLPLADTVVKGENKWSNWCHSVNPAGLRAGSGSSSGRKGESKRQRLESKLPNQPDAFASIFLDFSPDLYRGKRFEYTGWIKTDHVNGKATLWATAEDENDILSFDDMDDRAVKGTHDWHKYSVVIRVPANSNRLRLGFMLKGGGKAWLRAPEVKLADAHSKLTERPFDASKFRLNELENYPANLSFDDRSVVTATGQTMVNKWGVFNNEGYSVNADKSTGLNGKPSVRIDCDIPESKGFASIYKYFSAKNYVNKRVRFSGYIKTDAVKDWAGLFMQVDANDRVLAFDAMEERPVKGTKDWTKCNVVLDVPANSRKIKIGFLQAGAGKSWISNCALAAVDSSVPTTAKPVVDDRFPPLHLPAQPKLDFE